MKALILAAGEGKRMRPLTGALPKPLLPIAGKPFMDHIVSALPEEIDTIVLVVRYLEDKIRAHCGSEFYGKNVLYARGDERGNAMSFLAARELFSHGERFLLLYGDELVRPEEVHACLAHPYALLCYRVPDPHKSGIAIIDEKGFIRAVEEKPFHPASDLAVCGLMVVNADLFTIVPAPHANGEYYLSTMMNEFVKKHPVVAVRGSEDRPQFTTPDDLARLEELFYNRSTSL